MIKIITVYNTLNPGSLLQAISLYKKINEKYENVCFYKVSVRHPYFSGLKLFLKLICKFKVLEAFQQLIMPFKYNLILKNFRKSKQIDLDDIFVLGSDEIWNISRKNMSKYPILWGERFKFAKMYELCTIY